MVLTRKRGSQQQQREEENINNMSIEEFLIRSPIRTRQHQNAAAGGNSSQMLKAQEKPKTNEQILGEVFADLDVSVWPKKVSPGAPLDQWANYVIENPEAFKKKVERRVQQLRPWLTNYDDELEPIIVDGVLGEDTPPKRQKQQIPPREKGENQFEAFSRDFAAFFERQQRSKKGTSTAKAKGVIEKPSPADKVQCTQLLLQHFPLCRGLLVEQLVEEFGASYQLAAWICFFVESRHAHTIRRYFMHVDDGEWATMVSLMPEPRRRRKNWIEDPVGGPVAESMREFREQMANYREKYGGIFRSESDRLREDASTVTAPDDDGDHQNQSGSQKEAEQDVSILLLSSSNSNSNASSNNITMDKNGEEEGGEECQICFERFARHLSVHCFPPEQSHNNMLLPGLKKEVWEEEEEDQMQQQQKQPSTSKSTATFNQINDNNAHHQGGVPESQPQQFHSFCVQCFVGQAQAATGEMPLAVGGVGLPCMAAGCNNPILFSEYRAFIPPAVRRLLNARILEENLGRAGLANLERCQQCPYAVVIDAPPKEMRVFECLRCRHQHCRECERPWPGDHFGRRCEELTVDARVRQFENKMSDAVIRKCHRCQLGFVKDDGCNRMMCRCGASQCYLCRAQDIDYNHFCRHALNPGQTKCSVKSCKKTCLLWTNPVAGDRAELERVRREARDQGVQLLASDESDEEE